MHLCTYTTHTACYSPDDDDKQNEDNCSEGDRHGDKEDGSKHSGQDGGSHARQRFIWLIH